MLPVAPAILLDRVLVRLSATGVSLEDAIERLHAHAVGPRLPLRREIADDIGVLRGDVVKLAAVAGEVIERPCIALVDLRFLNRGSTALHPIAPPAGVDAHELPASAAHCGIARMLPEEGCIRHVATAQRGKEAAAFERRNRPVVDLRRIAG